MSDEPERAAKLRAALAARGIESVDIDKPEKSFAGAAEQLTAAAESNPIDAVVIGLAGGASSTATDGWARVLGTKEMPSRGWISTPTAVAVSTAS